MGSREMKTIPVGIGGLTCSACVRRVERALSETSGVKHVAVHLASETAYITLDPELIRLVDLETVIRNAGYEPKGVVHDLSGASKTETGKHQILNLVRIMTGLVTGSILMIVMFKDDWHTPIGSWFVFLLSTPVFIFISQPIFRNALQSLKHRILDMDVMYAMGMGASY